MGNQIFFVGNGNFQDVEGHLIGGVHGDSERYDQVISSGMDFGGKYHPVNVRGKVGLSPVRDLIVIPVSDAVHARASGIIRNLHELELEQKFPFYFGGMDDDQSPNSQFNPVKGTGYSGQPRHRARANCVTAFNWMARSSGAGLHRLRTDWNDVVQAYDVQTMFLELLLHKGASLEENYVSEASGDADDFSYMVINFDLGDGYQARMVRNSGEGDRVMAHQLMTKLYNHAGGYDAFRREMDGLKVFDAEPEALHPFIRAEFDALEI